MRVLIYLIFLGLLFLSPLSAQDEFCAPEIGFCFFLPPGWTALSVPPNNVIVRDSLNHSVNIDIIRYDIDAFSQINSDDGLLVAVSGFFGDLGAKILPGEMLDIMVDSGLAVFQTSFTTYDSADQQTTFKSLKGIIGRHPDAGQTLYLLIASAPEDLYQTSIGDINLVKHSFRITEYFADELYDRTSISSYLLVLLIMALIVFFFARNRRVQKSTNPLGRDTGNFWRCHSCRQINHVEHKTCRRCGHEREIPQPASR